MLRGITLVVVTVLAAILAGAWVNSPINLAARIELGKEKLRLSGQNTLLRHAHSVPGLLAPEGFAESKDGKTLFTSTMTGTIVRIEVDRFENRAPLPSDFVVVARMGSEIWNASCDDYSYENEPLCGRPLGLSWDSEGNLLVCEAYSGIYQIPKKILFASKNAIDLNLRPKLIVAANGDHKFFNVALQVDRVLYFTDSSSVYHRRDVPEALLDGRSLGRLFRVNLPGKTPELLADGFGFSNGLIAMDSDTLLVADSMRMQILRFHIRNSTISVFQHLPCMPDNLVHLPHRKLITVGCAAARSTLSEVLFRHGWIRRILAGLMHPGTVLSLSPKHGAVLLLDSRTGELVHTWEDAGAQSGIAVVSEAIEFAGRVWLGSWRPENSLSYIDANLAGLWPARRI